MGRADRVARLAGSCRSWWSRRSSASRCSRSSTTWSTTGCCARRSASASASATSGSTPRHSWNSNNIATNVLLYHLQRHSDHHANPTRRYQTLRDFEESPVLPTGYAGMIVLAMVPAGLAPGDGPARARPLRRRPRPGPTSAPASATRILRQHGIDEAARRGEQQRLEDEAVAAAAAASEVLAARCPGCGYTYDVARGDEREGFAAGHGVGRRARLLVLPRLRRAREGRLRAGRERNLPEGPA